MPAFILISGHFSRTIKSKNDLKKIGKTLVLPYIIFQIAYTFYYKNIFGDDVTYDFFEPRYALWFLLSMVMWKLMLTIFGRHWIMVVMSVVLSLSVGYISEVNEWLSLARIFFFFPFFLMGYYMSRENFVKMKNKWNVSIASILGLVLVIVIHLYGDVRWQEWLFGRIPYEEIEFSILEIGALSRLLVYVFMFVATYIFLSLVPENKRWYTNVGAKTLCVYLLHLFIIRAFESTVAYEWIKETGNYILLFGIAFIIVCVLSNKWIWKVIAPLITVKKKNERTTQN